MITLDHGGEIRVGPHGLPGDLVVVPQALGLVVFVHGSGSSRASPRNVFVAEVMHERRLSTLLFDLLTEDEAADRRNVFDIALLARRVKEVLDWLPGCPGTAGRPVGLFGASTGAAAALRSAAERPRQVQAVVSRGGRPDLADAYLALVQAPTLLIVGSLDTDVLRLNRAALRSLAREARLDVVPGASHLFEEPGTLGIAARLAGAWFVDHLGQGRAP
jgi:putative phosphoribosyl transferase